MKILFTTWRNMTKHKKCCEKCEQTDQDGTQKVLACKYLSTVEKATIVVNRQTMKLADEFVRKYCSHE